MDFDSERLQSVIRIDLLRHGACEGGEIFRGATDVALSAEGWAQMQATLARHAQPPWTRIVSSPLQRCRAFAEREAGRLGLPLVIDEDWRELSFGSWEGRARELLLAQDKAAVERFYLDPVNGVPPGGEPADAMQARVIAAYQRCLSQASGEHVLVVTHGGVIRGLLAHVLGMPLQRMFTLDVPYASLSGLHHVERAGVSRLLFHNPAAL